MELRSIQYFVQVADEVASRALRRRLELPSLPSLGHARAIMVEVSRASERVRGNAQAPRGSVVMGTSPTLAPLLLPGCDARARQQCPSVTLKVVEGFSPQLLDALLAGRLDLAVMTNPPRTTALALTPLCSEPLVVLSPLQRLLHGGSSGCRRQGRLPRAGATLGTRQTESGVRERLPVPQEGKGRSRGGMQSDHS